MVAMLTLIGGGAARAAYDPVAHGVTTITFSHQFAAALAKHGVEINVRDGERRGGRLVLNAQGGEIDPRLGAGTVESRGTILLKARKGKVVLREVTFKAKRAPLYAKVGGGQLKLASGARLSGRRSGFGVHFTASNLRLTAKLASRLNKKLRLGGLLHAGLPFANVTVQAQPATVHLKLQGRCSLVFNSAFASKLEQHFVSLNPIAPAELTAGPTLSFPIGPESTLAADGASGTVKLEGEAELLRLGEAQMFWRELWWEPEGGSMLSAIDVEPAPPHPGIQAQAPLLAVQGVGNVTSNPASRTIDLAGQPLALTEATAARMNEAFAGSGNAFVPGEPVGSMTLHAVAE